MKAAGWALACALAVPACAQPPTGLPLPSPAASPGPQATQPPDAQALQRLQASLATWQAMRPHVNAYRYQVAFESYTGFRSVTTVSVRAHQVVERRLETRAERGGALALQWVESSPELGTRPGAAPALTLDQLYAQALEVVNRPLRAHEQLSLGLDGRGLLQHCFIRDTRIADDAPRLGVPPLQLELD